MLASDCHPRLDAAKLSLLLAITKDTQNTLALVILLDSASSIDELDSRHIIRAPGIDQRRSASHQWTNLPQALQSLTELSLSDHAQATRLESLKKKLMSNFSFASSLYETRCVNCTLVCIANHRSRDQQLLENEERIVILTNDVAATIAEMRGSGMHIPEVSNA